MAENLRPVRPASRVITMRWSLGRFGFMPSKSSGSCRILEISKRDPRDVENCQPGNDEAELYRVGRIRDQSHQEREEGPAQSQRSLLPRPVWKERTGRSVRRWKSGT